MAWYWAGDSKKGSQDKWIKYDEDLERGYNTVNKKKVTIDQERFVDMSDKDNMVQRRYDDNNKQRAVKREDEEEEEEEEEKEEEVKWYWAGDQKTKKDKKIQWIEYSDSVASILESAFNNKKKKKVKVDDERFVDLSDRDEIVQRRYDDHEKVRQVKREVNDSNQKPKKKQKTSHATDPNNNNNNNNNNTTTTTTTSGRRTKNAANMNLMSEYEKQEYNMAMDPRLAQFYTDSAGLHEELVDNSVPINKKVTRDKHSNPSGADFDLGRDGGFAGFTVLIGVFLGVNLASPIAALKKKGFTVKETKSEKEFLKQLPKADIAWIISGTDPEPKKKTSTSSGENYPAWQTCTKKEFQKEVMKFHEDGGALFLWGDNDPLFEHTNSVLPLIMQDPKVVLVGNTPGGNVLKVGMPDKKQQFGRHIITSGIKIAISSYIQESFSSSLMFKKYEGVTICYPEHLGKLKVLATSSDNHPVICYADHEVLDPNCGRVVVDTGYTKNYVSWNEAGTARYIVNATVWLLGLEQRLIQGTELTSRAKRSKK